MMKTLYRTTPLLLVLALAACQNRQSAGEVPPVVHDVTAHTTGLGSTGGKLDASAVWNGSLDACRNAATASDTCLIDTLRKGGAWQSVEGVGVATLEFPFRANTNEGTWLVDASGRTVDVDRDVLDDNTRSLPEYKAFIAGHPDAVPFAPAIASGSAAFGHALGESDERAAIDKALAMCRRTADDCRLEFLWRERPVPALLRVPSHPPMPVPAPRQY